jgi:hypothetical protein
MSNCATEDYEMELIMKKMANQREQFRAKLTEAVQIQKNARSNLWVTRESELEEGEIDEGEIDDIFSPLHKLKPLREVSQANQFWNCESTNEPETPPKLERLPNGKCPYEDMSQEEYQQMVDEDNKYYYENYGIRPINLTNHKMAEMKPADEPKESRKRQSSGSDEEPPRKKLRLSPPPPPPSPSPDENVFEVSEDEEPPRKKQRHN